MARKTDGERVDDLLEMVGDLKVDTERMAGDLKVVIASLTERLDNVRQELKDLKKDLESARARLWLIVPPLLAALLSVALMALVNYLSRN